jgi:hypothetical protein
MTNLSLVCLVCCHIHHQHYIRTDRALASPEKNRNQLYFQIIKYSILFVLIDKILIVVVVAAAVVVAVAAVVAD